MKQIVPFTKKIELSTNIEEITSISLNHNLKDIKNCEIIGDFELYFEYRENDISVSVDEYSTNIPFNIDVDDKYSLEHTKVDIDDFYYEIENSLVILHIDVLLDGLELKEEELENIIQKHEDRELELDEEIEELIEENTNVEVVTDEEEKLEKRDIEIEDLFKQIDTDAFPFEIEVKEKKSIKPIFETFDPKNETYVTYNVHIVRNEENIDSICLKYNVTKEELSNYNDIKEIKLGDKLIVPTYKK